MADDLDGNVAAEFGVVGTVDLAHPAFAQRCDDLIDAEPAARFDGHFEREAGGL